MIQCRNVLRSCQMIPVALFACILICFENMRLLENVISRSLSVLKWISALRGSHMKNSVPWYSHFPDLLNSMIWHLSTLNNIFQVFDHSVRASRSLCRVSRSLTLRIVATNMLSSACQKQQQKKSYTQISEITNTKMINCLNLNFKNI